MASLATCERVLVGLDEDLIPFVAGLIDDADDLTEVVDQIAAFLVSGELCADEDAAVGKTRELLAALGKEDPSAPPPPSTTTAAAKVVVPPPFAAEATTTPTTTTTDVGATAALIAARAVFGDLETQERNHAAADRVTSLLLEEREAEKAGKMREKKEKARSGAERKYTKKASSATERVAAERAALARDLEMARVAAVEARWKMGSFKGAIEARNFTLANPGGGMSLVEDADMTLVRGSRYALVGRNGKGKSTLLQALAARRVGEIAANCSVHYVTQDVTLEVEDEARRPGDLVVDADVDRRVCLQEKERLAARRDLDELKRARLEAALDERLEAMDSDSAPRRADDLLKQLGFSEALRTRKMCELSGGWRVRTNLAAALFAKPDLLLLDEPTNHLSIGAVLWLTRELATAADWASRIVVVVSHDRVFLEDVCTDVLHISGAARRLTQSHGSYETWAARREDQKVHWERTITKRTAEVDKLREYAGHGFKYGGASSQINKMQMKAKQADKLEAEGEREATELAALEEDAELPLTLVAGGLVDGNLVSLTDVAFHYEGQPDLFAGADLAITSTSRVVFVGENGNGKTTLVKLIMGDLDPTTGVVKRSPHARIQLVNQHHADQIDLRMTPLEFMRATYPGDGSNAHLLKLRSHLAKCGVTGEDPDLMNVPCSALSGGQRSRVALAAVSYAQPHILVLDEPTNNLDLESVTALAECVANFQGAVVCVSHDQYFVSKVATEAFVVAKGAVKRAVSFQDYVKRQHARLK